ncbi:kelch repeat protein [Tritrichomonas foetus]|uniref:Kelch repeat protein n=1 Tax=Tritrichomonas foetus TaxID=1144522 RepID=A0A1J4KA04_9EUKA|nr:kelch repeat protein [Tritrichomonas foetus]|eukprot:OHT08263.1 kelch repeat protein [Tritrichomonas foetus]
MSVCVIRGCKANEIHPEGQFASKTTKEISEILSIQATDFLAIRTPNFQLRLNPDSVPLTEFPDLILQSRPEKFPPPPYHLEIIPNTETYDIILYFNIKTQMNTVFPIMGIKFTFDEIDTFTIENVLERCITTFGYDCTEQHILLAVDDSIVDPTNAAKKYLDDALVTPLIFSCIVSEAPQKKINHRIFNTTQILTTEQSYISDLNEIITFWEPAFREAKIFSEDEMRTLFRDIPTIRNSHNVFYASLQGCEVNFATEIGTKFLAFVQFFKLSATFVSQYKSVDALIKSKSSSRSFASKMKEIENNLPSGTGRDFLSFYITPVQRYPRYPLLLRDLDKETPAFHPDKPYLAQALLEIDQVNKHIDRSSFTMITLEVMDTLQKDFGSLIQINDPQRKLIFSASIKTNRPKLSNGTIFLFNDLVVIAAQPKKTYNYVFSSNIAKFRYVKMLQSPDSIMFSHENKDYYITFLDMIEKTKFFENFRDVRENYIANIKTENSYVLWNEIEVPDTVPSIMGHDGCFIKKHALFFGGNTVNSLSNSLIRYKISNSTWEVTLGSPLPRNSHTTTEVNGVAYVCFGMSRKELNNDIWKFDQDHGGWSQVQVQGEPPMKRMGHSAVEWQGKIIFFGGRDKQGTLLNDICVFDVNDLTFKRYPTLADSPIPRMNHSASIIFDKMVISGGKTEKGIVGELRVFDLITWKWLPKSDSMYISEKCQHKMFTIDKWLVIIGGFSNTNTPLVEVFDTNTQAMVYFENYGNKPFSLNKCAAVYIGNSKIILYGGEDLSTKGPSSYAYELDLSGIKQSKISNTMTNPLLSPKPNSKPLTVHSHNLIPHANLSNGKGVTSHSPPPNAFAKQQHLQIPSPTANRIAPKEYAPRISDILSIRELMEQKRNHCSSEEAKTTHPVQHASTSSNQTDDNQNDDVEENTINSIGVPKSSISNPPPGTVNESSRQERKSLPPNAKQNRISNATPVDLPNPKNNVGQENSNQKLMNLDNYIPSQTFIPEEVYNALGIDTSSLNPAELMATKIKARNFWIKFTNNRKIEEQIAEKEKASVNNFDQKMDSPILLKVRDEISKTIKILKASNGEKVDEITNLVNTSVARENAVLQIQTGNNKILPFNTENLKLAHMDIAKGGVKILKIVAK